MKSRKTALVWLGFALCAALVVAVMAWLSRGVIAAEQRRIEAEHARDAAEIRADLEERTRLALWRMDAAGAAVMLRENRWAMGESALPGNALGEVLLRFEVGREGGFKYPAADELGVEEDALAERIARFRKILETNPIAGGEWQLLYSAAVRGEVNWQVAREEQSVEEPAVRPAPALERRASDQLQVANNSVERAKRARVIDQALDAYAVPRQQPAQRLEAAGEASAPEGLLMEDAVVEDAAVEVSTTPMLAVWLGDELLLLRQITGSSGVERLQGVWIDWRVLASQLIGQIGDLMPKAKLVPVGAESVADPLTLVSFPMRLERPGAMVDLPSPAVATFGMALKIAWVGVGFALLAAGVLIAGIVRLSDRRASFVSAVTHELRTPLTTFRLYSDLLEKGVVQGEKRTHYLRVLTREADRLSHLVENVLAFSRIENGRADGKVRETTAGAILDETRERFTERLAAVGMALEVDPGNVDLPIRVDVAAVEHILFNLVDNAAKYAAGSSPAVVRISCARSHSGAVEILVRDHGPGIPEVERRRIFRPFHKSANAAAETCPGVGLGLALSLRLARSIRARLEIREAGGGACFALVLPAA